MTRRAFERLVRQVMRTLPPRLFAQLDNLVIQVDDEPPRDEPWGADPDLVAIYLGVPRTERGESYAMQEPDRIILFQARLEALADDVATLRREVKRTILHEVAHHYGISDEELEAWRRY